jgi:membrane fusion protein (multidrug efflux system)
MGTACDGRGQTSPPQAPPPPAVTVAPVTKSEIHPVFEFVGQTEAVDTVELRARVEGFLVKRAFAEGDDVSEGDLLFAIEKDPYAAALAAADADVEESQAVLARTRKDLERSRILFSRGNVSEKTLDDAVAAEREAAAQLAAAQARQREAQLNLGYTDIYAPIDGRIGRSAYSVGNLVGPTGDVLATLIKLDPIYAVFNVSERLYLDYQQRVAAVAAGGGGAVPDPVPRLRLANDTAYPNAGRIEFVDNRVDPTTGTIAVRAVFPNPDKLLVPGLFVTVELKSRESKPALLVPQAAVQEDQAGRFVLVAKPDNTAEVRRIETGDRTGTEWQVTSGLGEGELVIYEGIQKVRPGAKIAPVVRPPGTAPAAAPAG